MEPTILGKLTEDELSELLALVSAKQSSFHDLGVVAYLLLSGKATFDSSVLERCRLLEETLAAENTIKGAVVLRLGIAEGVQWAISSEGLVVATH